MSHLVDPRVGVAHVLHVVEDPVIKDAKVSDHREGGEGEGGAGGAMDRFGSKEVVAGHGAEE